MTLFDKYQNGDCINVYNEIYALGPMAFHSDYFDQIDLVLKETFKRTAYNLNIIYNELKDTNYLFTTDIKEDWQIPLLPPYPDVDVLISKLKSTIEEDQCMPLSLEYFYKIVGSCNFCWDWETNPDVPWEGADPIQIPPISTLLELDGYNKAILISGDYLQKDNVSGDCYSIELTEEPSIDSLFLGWDIPFIEYLRLTINNCGFTMADQCDYESLDIFCNRVKPKLIDI